MAKLELENDKYILKPGLIQKLLLVVIVLYIILALVNSIPNELEQVKDYELVQKVLIFGFFVAFLIFVLFLLLLIFYSDTYSFEYNRQIKKLTTYNDIVLVKIKMRSKDLKKYNEVEVEEIKGTKRLFLKPKNKTLQKEFITKVGDQEFSGRLWKELLEEIRKEIG